MNRKLFMMLTAISFMMLLVTSSIAQKPRKKRVNNRSAYGNTTTQDTTKPTTTPPPTSGYGGGATQQVAGNGGDTLKVVEVKSSGNGLIDSTKPSLRNDAAIELNLIKDRTPLEYENIREDDAVYRVRVWREIDAREKINLPFRYAAVEDNGSQRFISILLAAIKSGQTTAFSGDDDRFTTPITPDQALAAFGGGTTLSNHFDSLGNVDYKVKRQVQVEPDSIYKFEIKEEWIFDKETSRMYVRILGIAPVIPYKLSTGDIVPGSERPVWWVYYPDLRPTLAKYEVYNPKNFGARMTWEDLFEGRMFSSFILKSTLDNPFDQTLAQKYPANSLFRLLEGDKIKDKIFDYEQSLWSY